MTIFNNIPAAFVGSNAVQKAYLNNSVIYTAGTSVVETLMEATGGNVEYFYADGKTYKVHTFNTDDDFIVSDLKGTSGEIEYLVVAGGGAGPDASDRTSGGGGAGGVLTGSTTLSATTYPIVIGAGGSASAKTNGGNSTGFGLTAIGGGVGGGNTTPGNDAGNGGSGGGSRHNPDSSPGTGTAGQGNNGGTGWDSGTTSQAFAGGGGGGAGQAGSNATTGSTGSAGKGGDGIESSITGTPTYYGGGGGGGAQFNSSNFPNYDSGDGGLGGGGKGARNPTSGSRVLEPEAGAANTGGGGGGGAGSSMSSFTGADGGSGVVIVKYLYANGIYTPPANFLIIGGRDGSGRAPGTDYANNYGNRWSYFIKVEEEWDDVAVNIETMIGIKNGALYTGGEDFNGILGNGATTGNQDLTQIDAGPGWTQVEISDTTHRIALGLKNGELYTWGDDVDTPTRVDNNIYVKASLKRDHWAAIKEDGTLWVFGNNNNYQLGLGNTVDVSTPTQVGVDTDWVDVEVGDEYMVALKSNGALYSVGRNTGGRTGQGTSSGNTTSLTRIGTDTWKTFSASILGVIAINSSNELYAWGTWSNDSGDVPTQVGSNNDWKQCWVTRTGYFALNNNGELYAWGYSYRGNLHTNIEEIDGNVVFNVEKIGDFDSIKNISSNWFVGFTAVVGIPSIENGTLTTQTVTESTNIIENTAYTFDAINYIGEPPLMTDFSYVYVLSATITGTWTATVDNDFDITITPNTLTQETLTVTYTTDGVTSVGTRTFDFQGIVQPAGIILQPGPGTYDLSAFLDPNLPNAWSYLYNDPVDMYIMNPFTVDIFCYAPSGASGTLLVENAFTGDVISIPYTVS